MRICKFIFFVLVAWPTLHAEDEAVFSFKTENGEQLNERLLSYNTNLVRTVLTGELGFDSPVFMGMVLDLNPGGLRFPGGTIGNSYLWRDDSFAIPEGDLMKWAKEVLTRFRAAGHPYGQDAFIRLTRRLGIEPIWVANIFDYDAAGIVAWLSQIRASGGKVTSVELGNEAYWDWRSHNDVAAYVAHARPVAEAIRAWDPSVKIGVCVGPLNRRGRYETTWNQPIASDPSWYDAVIHHEYLGGQGIAVDENLTEAGKEVMYLESEIRHGMEAMKTLFPDKKVWLTEWNLGRDLTERHRWSAAHLVSLASLFGELLHHSEVLEWANFHQVAERLWGTFEYNSEAGRVERTPVYFLWRLVGDLIEANDTVFLNEPPDGAMRPDSGDLVIIGFGSRGQVREMLCINKSAFIRSPSILINGKQAEGRAAITALSRPDSNARYPFPASLEIYDYAIASLDQLRLPPFSVCRVEIN